MAAGLYPASKVSAGTNSDMTGPEHPLILQHEPAEMALGIKPHSMLSYIIDIGIIFCRKVICKHLCLASSGDLHDPAVFNPEPDRLLQHADTHIGDTRVRNDNAACTAFQRRYICLNCRKGGKLPLLHHAIKMIAPSALS